MNNCLNEHNNKSFSVNNPNKGCSFGVTSNTYASNVTRAEFSLENESFSRNGYTTIDVASETQARLEDLNNQTINSNQETSENQANNKATFKFYRPSYTKDEYEQEKNVAGICLRELPQKLRKYYDEIFNDAKYYLYSREERIGSAIMELVQKKEITSHEAFQMQLQLAKDAYMRLIWNDKEFELIHQYFSNEHTTPEYHGIYKNISNHKKYWCGVEIKPDEYLDFSIAQDDGQIKVIPSIISKIDSKSVGMNFMGVYNAK